MRSNIKKLLAVALICAIICPIIAVVSLKTEAIFSDTAIQKIDLTGATATADSKHSNASVGAASAVIDGDVSNSLSTAWISVTSGGGEYTEHWLQIDLPTAVTLNKIVMVPRLENGVPTYFPKDFTVEVSYDGVSWITVAKKSDYTATNTAGEQITFNTQSDVTSIRINVTRNTAYNSGKSVAYGFGLTELEAYYDPMAIQTIDFTGATATADSKHSSTSVGAASAVIDGDVSNSLSTAWISATSTGGEYTSHWLQIDLPTAVTLNKIVMVPRLENGVPTYFPKDFTVEVSKDGVSWITVAKKSDYTATNTAGEELAFKTQKDVNSIRINVSRNTAHNSGKAIYYGFGLTELEAYYDPALNVTKIDATGATATADSKHPSADVGAASAVIDGGVSDSLSTAWISATSTGGEYTPHWLQIDLPTAVTLNKIVMVPRLESGVPTYFPKDFTVEVSNDGIRWITVVQKSHYTATNTAGEELAFSTETGVKSVRINVTRNTAYNSGKAIYYGFGLTELELHYDETVTPESLISFDDVLKISSVEASSSHYMHPVKHLTDGNLNNIWSNDDPNNRPDPSANTQVILELDKLSNVSGVYLYPTIKSSATPNINFPHKFSIYLSEDGESFGEAVWSTDDYALPEGSTRECIKFDELIGNVKYVKFDIAPGNNAQGYVHFAEIEVIGLRDADIGSYASELGIREHKSQDAKIVFTNTSSQYKHEIIASSNEGTVDLSGYITQPERGYLNVELTVRITSILDENKSITVKKSIMIKSNTLFDAELAAANITLLPVPSNEDAYITVPTVEGYTVTIANSDDEGIVALDGRITRPESTTGVRLTLKLTSNETGETSYTKPLLVPIYKPYTKPAMTEAEIEAAHKDYEDNAYGIFIHYVSRYRNSRGTVYSDGEMVESVDELADAFDVKAFAKSMHDMGAEYVLFTAWHGDTRTLFPSMTNLRWRDDRRAEDTDGQKSYSERDVIAELIEELSVYGIDLYLYTHPADGGPDFTSEDKLLTGWDDSADNYAVWNQYVNELYYELCERYGDGIKGLWFDGEYNHVPAGDAQNRLRETCLSFNPAMILTANLAFKEGTVYESPVYDGADYFCWEIPEGYNFVTDRRISRHQAAAVIANAGWWTQHPNTTTFANLPTAEEIFKYLVAMSSVSTQGGFLASTGFYPLREGEVLDDYFMCGIGDVLRNLNSSYISPLKATIFNTNNSTAYPTTENITVSDLLWGVANESKDGKTIYLHVLNAPDGNTLLLPKTADGTILNGEAVIMNYDGTETPIAIVKTENGYSITLPEGVEWNDVDTVIKAERMEFDFIPKTSITLGSELVYNVYVPATDFLKSYTVNGLTYEDAEIVTLEDGKSYYHVAVSMPASEAAGDIVLKVILTIDGKDYTGTFTMSIPKYARAIIEMNSSEEEVTLVKDVLAYIRAAYVYFNAADKDEAIAVIDEVLGTYESEFAKVEGNTNTAEGLK
ncbi:MAG: discoidin domain-containing protein, partial [Clostridia bacterium]|nr:discoidin domain-containing protein [Clostridia bacterium]